MNANIILSTRILVGGLYKFVFKLLKLFTFQVTFVAMSSGGKITFYIVKSQNKECI